MENNRLQRLNLMISEINSLYHEAACFFGMSDSVMTILYTVCTNGGSCMLSALYKSSGMCRQTVNSALRKMERDSLLYLENNGKKTKRVFLTEKGKELAENSAEKIIAAENRLLDGWTDGDVGMYIELNRKYAEDFKKELEKLMKGDLCGK